MNVENIENMLLGNEEDFQLAMNILEDIIDEKCLIGFANHVCIRDNLEVYKGNFGRLYIRQMYKSYNDINRNRALTDLVCNYTAIKIIIEEYGK